MTNTAIAIKVTKVAQSKLTATDFSNLVFGKVFTDHMFVADYINGEWCNFEILPYGPISISPAAAVLHYGQEIFEGMKAYKLPDGQVSVFRPEKNHQRLNVSALRMAMPEIPEEIFMQGLQELVKLDAAWVPDKENHSLYLRPFMYADDPYLGVQASRSYKFMILACPVGPFYNKALKVKIETTYTRADDGGVGYAKTGGNYARSLVPTIKALEEGFDQLIWTDSKTNSFVEESGTANLMFVIDGKLVTPTVRETVLDGITRDSIIKIAQHLGYSVEERRISIAEVLENAEKGNLTECFAVGTAATVTQISSIGYEGKVWDLQDAQKRPISQCIVKFLDDLRYGRSEDVFGWNMLIK